MIKLDLSRLRHIEAVASGTSKAAVDATEHALRLGYAEERLKNELAMAEREGSQEIIADLRTRLKEAERAYGAAVADSERAGEEFRAAVTLRDACQKLAASVNTQKTSSYVGSGGSWKIPRVFDVGGREMTPPRAFDVGGRAVGSGDEVEE